MENTYTFEEIQQIFANHRNTIDKLMHDKSTVQSDLDTAIACRNEAISAGDISGATQSMNAIQVIENRLNAVNEIIAEASKRQPVSDIEIGRTWNAVTRNAVLEFEQLNAEYKTAKEELRRIYDMYNDILARTESTHTKLYEFLSSEGKGMGIFSFNCGIPLDKLPTIPDEDELHELFSK